MNAGDLEKGRDLELAKQRIQDTLGLIRYHPYSSALGGSQITNGRTFTRSDEGKFAERGSQQHFSGALARANKATIGILLKASVNANPKMNDTDPQKMEGQENP